MYARKWDIVNMIRTQGCCIVKVLKYHDVTAILGLIYLRRVALEQAKPSVYHSGPTIMCFMKTGSKAKKSPFWFQVEQLLKVSPEGLLPVTFPTRS